MKEKRRPGRPAKPQDEHAIRAPLSLPPDLWEEFKALVPPMQRSKVAARAIRRELDEIRRSAVLQQEWATYLAERRRLALTHAGLFVLIHGSEVIGVFASADDAHAEGFARFGRQPFLVHRILPDG